MEGHYMRQGESRQVDKVGFGSFAPVGFGTTISIARYQVERVAVVKILGYETRPGEGVKALVGEAVLMQLLEVGIPDTESVQVGACYQVFNLFVASSSLLHQLHVGASGEDNVRREQQQHWRLVLGYVAHEVAPRGGTIRPAAASFGSSQHVYGCR